MCVCIDVAAEELRRFALAPDHEAHQRFHDGFGGAQEHQVDSHPQRAAEPVVRDHAAAVVGHGEADRPPEGRLEPAFYGLASSLVDQNLRPAGDDRQGTEPRITHPQSGRCDPSGESGALTAAAAYATRRSQRRRPEGLSDSALRAFRSKRRDRTRQGRAKS